MMKKLSFIVPVYNVASYLQKCVDSLLAQDIPASEYEIILVDDGSLDSCPLICDNYAASHENIRVIHQENAGLSAARNTGIAAAIGEYICFVDSDDYWQPNVLASLLAQIQCEQLDVLRFDYQNVRLKDSLHLEYEVFEPNKYPKRDVDFSEDVVDGETFLNERLGPACYAVMFIIRRDIILFSNTHIGSCLFTKGIYFEDVDWTPRMLLRAKRVASTEKVVYNYLWRAGSITLPSDTAKRKKVLEDTIRLIQGFKEQSMFVQNQKWFIRETSLTTMSILYMLTDLPAIERKSYIKELKSLHVFPLSLKKEKRLTSIIKIYIANISPELFCLIMRLRK